MNGNVCCVQELIDGLQKIGEGRWRVPSSSIVREYSSWRVFLPSWIQCGKKITETATWQRREHRAKVVSRQDGRVKLARSG